MSYHSDLSKITLDAFQRKLESAWLPPSRMLLKENIAERFAMLKNMGISNVQGLAQMLKNKKQMAGLSSMQLFTAEYLTVLLREINSMLPKPNKLNEFSCVSAEMLGKLEEHGITNTLQLYDKTFNAVGRKNLAEKTGLEVQRLTKLAKLADLSRIKWVGASYAQILFDLGADTVAKVAVSDPEVLHGQINRHIKEKNVFKGSIGLNDVRILVETAAELPVELDC